MLYEEKNAKEQKCLSLFLFTMKKGNLRLHIFSHQQND
jgi:hypothetical protein